MLGGCARRAMLQCGGGAPWGLRAYLRGARLVEVLGGGHALRWLRRRRAAARVGGARLLDAALAASGPAGPDPVWFHAASLGELLSVRPLAGQLLLEGYAVHVTFSSASALAALPPAAPWPPGLLSFGQAPLELPHEAHAFVAALRPSAAVLVESELWPVMLSATRGCGVPQLLLQGRLSERSASRWALTGASRAALRWLLQGFALVIARSAADAARLASASGAGAVPPVAELKLCGASRASREAAAHALPDSLRALRALMAASRATAAPPGAAPSLVWVAASTHPGEEAVVAAAHASLRHGGVRALTVVAPRHPERAAGAAREAAAVIRAQGLADRVLLASELGAGDAAASAAPAVILVDSLGHLAALLPLADAALVGGSLRASLAEPKQHNAFEPLLAGCALVLQGDRVASPPPPFVEVLDGDDALALRLRDIALRPLPSALLLQHREGTEEVLARVLALCRPLLPRLA